VGVEPVRCGDAPTNAAQKRIAMFYLFFFRFYIGLGFAEKREEAEGRG
jgi:hypothetical protein